MKKFLAILLAIVTAVLMMSGCHHEVKSNPIEEVTYYNPQFMYFDYLFNESDDAELYTEGKGMSESLQQEIYQIFDRVEDYYGVEKEAPEVRVVTEKQLKSILGCDEETPVYGAYIASCKAIYIKENVDIENVYEKHTIIHEYLHYLSDNTTKRGCAYRKEDRTFGKFFNEGVTNYLAKKVSDIEVDQNYEFETHIAQQVETIVGKKVLENAYFNSDVSELRKIFNESLKKYYPEEETSHEGKKLDIFDAFVSQIDEYSYLFIYEGKIPEAFSMCDSVEEEILFLAKANNCLAEAKENLQQFTEIMGKEVEKHRHLKDLL